MPGRAVEKEIDHGCNTGATSIAARHADDGPGAFDDLQAHGRQGVSDAGEDHGAVGGMAFTRTGTVVREPVPNADLGIVLEPMVATTFYRWQVAAVANVGSNASMS